MFDRLRIRYVGRHDWPSVTASVCSTEFHIGNGKNQPQGYYDVVYTFWIDGHIYEGKYREAADGLDAPYRLKKDDPVEVLYCPSDPNINFNPDFDFIYQNGLTPVFVAVGAAIAIAVVAIVLKK